MLTITDAAQEFLDEDLNFMLVTSQGDGIEHLLVDVVDFTDQNVFHLFGDKYVIVYIVQDIEPKPWATIQREYLNKCEGTANIYPDKIREKLVAYHGEQKIYIHEVTDHLMSSFDWDSLTADEKAGFREGVERVTDYVCVTDAGKQKMWTPLNDMEINAARKFSKSRMTESLKDLEGIEMCVERPYSVHVFNESENAFIRAYETYEKCADLVAKIHEGKLNVLLSDMVIV